MKISRRQLKKMIMEQMRRINEHGKPVALDSSMSLPEMVEAALSIIPQPYTVEIVGNKVVCTIDDNPENVAFEVIFK